MSKPERFTNATGAPVPDNTNIMTAGVVVRLYSRHLADREARTFDRESF